MNHPGIPDPSAVSQIRMLLDGWHSAFKAYTASLLNDDHLELRTASVLDIHFRILSIMLDIPSSKPDSTYDNYLDDFRTLLNQCEEIIKFRESAPTNDWAEYGDRLSLFEFDFGMITPLFVIACHCRDPALRRKAIRLMRYLHRTRRRVGYMQRWKDRRRSCGK